MKAPRIILFYCERNITILSIPQYFINTYELLTRDAGYHALPSNTWSWPQSEATKGDIRLIKISARVNLTLLLH